ncbi:MAG: hypothetical protein JW727_02200 [Candidatus Aenigmarchaeota archaeon]|nr:hypothetical protein [Candidatus Aenigmarchaeota archaeon]
MLLTFVFALILAVFAGLYDLKTSNVHEEVPAVLISGGLFYWLVYSLVNSDLSFAVSSLLTGIVFLLSGLLLYRARVWGDGDAWILGGLGFCLPAISAGFLSPFTEVLPYAAYFMFTLFLVGGVYSVFYIVLYGILNRSILSRYWVELGRRRAIYIGALFAGIATSVFVPYFFVMGLLPWLYTYAKVVEAGMKRKIPVSQLKEDDVLAGGDIRGLKREEFEELRRTRSFVDIQEGVRFTMVFSLTLVFLYFGGVMGLAGVIF